MTFPTQTSNASPGTAIVVGGGLAGIAAAVRLAQHGVAATLIETRQRLGGRATSFIDPLTHETLDNCQHVLMRCCTNLIDLYQRLGVADDIQWHRTLYFADALGRIDTLEADHLPAPLHMTRSMLGMKTLSLKEKIAIARGMLAILQLGSGRDDLCNESFAQWLREQDQPDSVIDRFWGPIIISACNEQPENVAACYAIQVFQDGFLAHDDAYHMGLASVPLVELYNHAERVIAQAGGRVLKSTSAQSFEFDGHNIVGLCLGSRAAPGFDGSIDDAEGGTTQVSTDSQDQGLTLRADAYIAAVPFDRLRKLATSLMMVSDERLEGLDRFDVSPIIGIHLFFSREDGRAVMDLPYLALTQSPVQWVFNKSTQALKFEVRSPKSEVQSPKSEVRSPESELGGATHLHCVISAAHDLVDQPADQIISLATAEVHKVIPGAREAKLVHARVIKEKRATFSIRPGVDRLRPRTRGAIANLLLAGDWCDTGWPATMEGAVRSGYRAAGAALALIHSRSDPSHANANGVSEDEAMMIPDLPAGPLYRFMTG